MTGTLIMDTPSAEEANKWLYNWTEEGVDAVVRPMVDDNQVREIILGAPPAYMNNYDSIGMEAPEGYTLFSIFCKMYPDKKDECYTAFANMTEQQDKADPGNVKVLCRYHDMGMGEVFCVAAAKHETAVMGSHQVGCKCSKISLVFTNSVSSSSFVLVVVSLLFHL